MEARIAPAVSLRRENRPGRIEWIDVAKGLGMVLVIYGHLLLSEGLWVAINRAIYSFHMPMYFVLSGYVVHPRRTTFGSFVKGQAYKLLIPAAVFIVATLPLYFYQTHDIERTVWEHLEYIFSSKGWSLLICRYGS